MHLPELSSEPAPRSRVMSANDGTMNAAAQHQDDPAIHSKETGTKVVRRLSLGQK